MSASEGKKCILENIQLSIKTLQVTENTFTPEQAQGICTNFHTNALSYEFTRQHKFPTLWNCPTFLTVSSMERPPCHGLEPLRMHERLAMLCHLRSSSFLWKVLASSNTVSQMQRLVIQPDGVGEKKRRNLLWKPLSI